MEDFIPNIESTEQPGASLETAKEVSEKFKESVKRGKAKIKKTKKDEAKAKKGDFLLAGFLVRIIINKQYDTLLPFLFKTIDDEFPSNFLLGILSLINVEVSDKIRQLSGKQKITFQYHSNQLIPFDDHHLDDSVKNRINLWVEDIIDIVSIEYSSLLTERLIKKINTSQDIVRFTSETFTFFLRDINISITQKKSIDIATFILNEVEKSLKKLEIEEI